MSKVIAKNVPANSCVKIHSDVARSGFLTPGEKAVFLYLMSLPPEASVTHSDIALALGVSRNTVRSYANSMRGKGVLRYSYSGGGGGRTYISVYAVEADPSNWARSGSDDVYETASEADLGDDSSLFSENDSDALGFSPRPEGNAEYVPDLKEVLESGQWESALVEAKKKKSEEEKSLKTWGHSSSSSVVKQERNKMSRFEKTREESELVVDVIAYVIESQWGKKLFPKDDGPTADFLREAMVEAVWRDTNPIWAWQEALKALVVEDTRYSKPPKFGDVKAKVESFMEDTSYPRHMELVKWHQDRRSDN